MRWRGAATFNPTAYDSTLLLLLFLVAAFASGTIIAGDALNDGRPCRTRLEASRLRDHGSKSTLQL
jgi:hypothetical protein